MLRKKSVTILVIVSMSLLSGCWERPSTHQPNIQQEEETGKKNGVESEHLESKKIRPLSVSEGEFEVVIGWLNDETIVYLSTLEQRSILTTYNIFSGTTVTLYESESPIASVDISPSKEKLLIHTSPSNNKAILTIIDLEGTELISKSIVSSEIMCEWNSYNEDQVLISQFNEEWEFQVSIFNIKENKLSKLSLNEPFANWLNKDELIYLDWDEFEPSLFAPVVKQGSSEQKGEQLDFANVFKLFSFNDILLTISVVDSNQDKAVYTFYSNQLKALQEFTIPQLTSFSDWLIPYHDFNHKKKQFITLSPVTSGEADIYQDGFQLVKFNLDDGKKSVLLEDIDNCPISISPDGKYCLFGNQLESIINLDLKTINELVEV